MKSPVNGGGNLLYRHFFTLLIMLFGVRVFQILLNFRSEFGGLFRPMPLASAYTGIIIGVAAIVLLILAVYHSKALSDRLQNRLLLFLFFEYLLIGLLHNKVGQRSFICEIIDGNLPFDELLSLYAVDFFFEPPYYFWGLAWLAGSYRLAAATARKHLLPVVWAPVLLPITLGTNAFPAVFAVAATLAAVVCSKWCQKHSASAVMWFWAISQLALLAWLNHSAVIYRTSWLVTLLFFPLIWLPALLLNHQLSRERTGAANAVTWLLPAFCNLTYAVVLTHVPLADNLFNLWFSITSLHFAFWSLVPAIALLVTALAAGHLVCRLRVPVFLALAAPLLCFYLIDGLVMFKIGLRLTFNTFDWILGLSHFASLATTISSTRDAWPLLLVISALPLSYLLVFRFSSGTTAVYRLSPLLITAAAASLAWQAFGIVPTGLFKDPARMFLASIPGLSFEKSDKRTLPELTRGFADCGMPRLKPAPAATDRQAPAKQIRNLVLIMLESTSNRYISLFGHNESTWPQLADFKNRMEIFPFFFSCFPETSNADFTIMSGLYPPNFLLLRQKPDLPLTLLVDHFKRAGYDCSMFLSGFLGDTGKSAFYKSHGFDRMFDALNMPGAGREEGWIWGVKEHHVVSQVNEQISKMAAAPEKPFFIYYRMLYPHAPFQSISGAAPVFNEDGHQQGNMVGRFKNCLLYQDSEIARLIRHLDASTVGSSTAVMIVADHGTMLGESGRLGHGWSLDPWLTNVPMLLIRPEATGFLVNSRPGSQIDILPTALALTGLPQPTMGFCQGLNLLATDESVGKEVMARNIFLSSMSQAAIVDRELYYWFAEDENEAPRAFRFSWENEGVRWVPELNVTSATFGIRRQQAGEFQKLQKSLLFNMEHYLRDQD